MDEFLMSEGKLEEIDRCARAYGWEIGRGHPMTSVLKMSDDNPFRDPNWKDVVQS